MRIVDHNIILKERVTISDALFIYKLFKNCKSELSKLKQKKNKILLFICNYKIFRNVIFYQKEILKKLILNKYFLFTKIRYLGKIMSEYGWRKEDQKEIENYENLVMSFCTKIAVSQKSFPNDVSEKTTFDEAIELQKEILRDKIDKLITFFHVTNYQFIEDKKWINKKLDCMNDELTNLEKPVENKPEIKKIIKNENKKRFTGFANVLSTVN